MFGLGTPELLVILGIVALLFGPAIVAFVAGYLLGERRGSSQPQAGKPPVIEPPAAAAEPPAPETEDADQTENTGHTENADETENEDGDLHV